jgi:anti-sigma B factor antagonist
MADEALEMISLDDAESGFRVLSLHGPLVLKNLFEFQAVLRTENANGMILDLTGVEYMDSAGLGAILGAFASYQRRKKPFALANVNARIRTLFEVTHTDQFLMPYA